MELCTGAHYLLSVVNTYKHKASRRHNLPLWAGALRQCRRVSIKWDSCIFGVEDMIKYLFCPVKPAVVRACDEAEDDSGESTDEGGNGESEETDAKERSQKSDESESEAKSAGKGEEAAAAEKSPDSEEEIGMRRESIARPKEQNLAGRW